MLRGYDTNHVLMVAAPAPTPQATATHITQAANIFQPPSLHSTLFHNKDDNHLKLSTFFNADFFQQYYLSDNQYVTNNDRDSDAMTSEEMGDDDIVSKKKLPLKTKNANRQHKYNNNNYQYSYKNTNSDYTEDTAPYNNTNDDGVNLELFKPRSLLWKNKYNPSKLLSQGDISDNYQDGNDDDTFHYHEPNTSINGNDNLYLTHERFLPVHSRFGDSGNEEKTAFKTLVSSIYFVASIVLIVALVYTFLFLLVLRFGLYYPESGTIVLCRYCCIPLFLFVCMYGRRSELIFGPSTTIRPRNDSGNRNNTVVASASGSGDEGNDDAEVGNTLKREEVRAAVKRLLEKWCFVGIYPPKNTSKSNTSSSRASEGTKDLDSISNAEETATRTTPFLPLKSDASGCSTDNNTSSYEKKGEQQNDKEGKRNEDGDEEEAISVSAFLSDTSLRNKDCSSHSSESGCSSGDSNSEANVVCGDTLSSSVEPYTISKSVDRLSTVVEDLTYEDNVLMPQGSITTSHTSANELAKKTVNDAFTDELDVQTHDISTTNTKVASALVIKSKKGEVSGTEQQNHTIITDSNQQSDNHKPEGDTATRKGNLDFWMDIDDTIPSCSICFEQYEPTDHCYLNLDICRHQYHVDCILGWYEQSDEPFQCPCCRRDTTTLTKENIMNMVKLMRREKEGMERVASGIVGDDGRRTGEDLDGRDEVVAQERRGSILSAATEEGREETLLVRRSWGANIARNNDSDHDPSVIQRSENINSSCNSSSSSNAAVHPPRPRRRNIDRRNSNGVGIWMRERFLSIISPNLRRHVRNNRMYNALESQGDDSYNDHVEQQQHVGQDRPLGLGQLRRPSNVGITSSPDVVNRNSPEQALEGAFHHQTRRMESGVTDEGSITSLSTCFSLDIHESTGNAVAMAGASQQPQHRQHSNRGESSLSFSKNSLPSNSLDAALEGAHHHQTRRMGSGVTDESSIISFSDRDGINEDVTAPTDTNSRAQQTQRCLSISSSNSLLNSLDRILEGNLHHQVRRYESDTTGNDDESSSNVRSLSALDQDNNANISGQNTNRISSAAVATSPSRDLQNIITSSSSSNSSSISKKQPNSFNTTSLQQPASLNQTLEANRLDSSVDFVMFIDPNESSVGSSVYNRGHDNHDHDGEDDCRLSADGIVAMQDDSSEETE